jgi:cytochrome c-type biogenesis protein
MAVSPRRRTFLHALSFVVGFSIVFVTLGASVAFVGYALNAYLPLFMQAGGLILVVFGLQVSGMLGWIAERVRTGGGQETWPGRRYLAIEGWLSQLLYTEGRVHVRAERRLGYISSVLMGVFFSAGWIPCVGPVLAAIYLLASNSQTAAQGALMLLAYSTGLSLPFLAAGAAFGSVTGWLRRLNRHLGLVAKLTGLFLVAIGVLLFTQQLTLISTLIVARFGTGWAAYRPAAAAVISVPIAFVAGLLSFLSPCVLPLIPAYITYLSGTAMMEGEIGSPSHGRT